MNIILIGPPGSGKSTQGDLLAQKLNLPYFSVGQLLRKIAEGSSEQANQIRSYLNEGNLVPDSVILPLIEEHVSTQEHRDGFIMDGFPRNLEQAQAFKRHIDKVIYVNLPDKEALWRIAKRTDKRDDQSAATIMHRVDIFHNETDPVIEHYREQNKLIEVDGMPSIEEIHTDILEKLA